MPENKFQDKLTSRERVRRVFERAGTDRIPVGEILIDDIVISRYMNCSSVGFEEKLAFVADMGHDIFCIHPRCDNDTGGGDLPAEEDIVFPSLEEWVKKTDIFTFAVIDNVFGWGSKVFDFYKFMSLPLKSPLEFRSFVNRVEKLNTGLIEYLLDAGIDGIIIADDLAYQQGLVVSPSLLRDYVFPSLEVQIKKAVGRYGTPVLFHSDGNINELMQDIVDAGFNGIHCVDRNSGMEVSDLQKRYGERLCFWGTLDVEDIEKVNDYEYLQGLKKTVTEASKNHGFILGTSCGIFESMDLESLKNLYNSLVFL